MFDVTNVLAIPKRFQNESHTKGSESGRKFGKQPMALTRKLKKKSLWATPTTARQRRLTDYGGVGTIVQLQNYSDVVFVDAHQCHVAFGV